MTRPKGWRVVRRHHNYTIEEVARNQGVTRTTVRRWIEKGLPCLKDQRPFLVLGTELIAFLKARKQPNQKCAPHQLYCLKCRGPRDAAFGEAELLSGPNGTQRIRALCGVCSTVMHKAVSSQGLEVISSKLRITSKSPAASIGETTLPPSDVHLERA